MTSMDQVVTRYPRWYALLLNGLICLLLAGAAHAQFSAPRLLVDSEVASAGFYRLSWETDSLHTELQEATAPGFEDARILYQGADRAAVISGKPNGTWYYRIRTVEEGHPGPWSEPLSVVVSHHSLDRAIAFFALGVLIFIGILVMVVRGARGSGGHVS